MLTRTLAALIALTPLTLAQAKQDDLRARYEQKLGHEFIEYGGWVTDYGQALAKAKAEDKAIFVYFSRSYAP